MSPVGLANTRISTGYDGPEIALPDHLTGRLLE